MSKPTIETYRERILRTRAAQYVCRAIDTQCECRHHTFFDQTEGDLGAPEWIPTGGSIRFSASREDFGEDLVHRERLEDLIDPETGARA